jgi:uncharacterized protein with ParB-like and HNH nuclease domain
MKISEMILNRINKDYLLPSIQREFVWKRKENKIEKLFDSIMQEYPFGSFLVWKINKDPNCENIKWEIYKFAENFDEDNSHNSPANLNGYSNINLILDGHKHSVIKNKKLKLK